MYGAQIELLRYRPSSKKKTRTEYRKIGQYMAHPSPPNAGSGSGDARWDHQWSWTRGHTSDGMANSRPAVWRLQSRWLWQMFCCHILGSTRSSTSWGRHQKRWSTSLEALVEEILRGVSSRKKPFPLASLLSGYLSWTQA